MGTHIQHTWHIEYPYIVCDVHVISMLYTLIYLYI